MHRSEIKPKVEYAFREKRSARTPLQLVRVIEHVRGNKWKVEWIDPNPGLVHYASSVQLVALWKDHKAFLKEEENEQRLKDHNERHGYVSKNDPVVRALQQVYESAGEDINFYNGCLTTTPEVLDRFRARVGLDRKEVSLPAYVDSHGKVHLPFDKAFELGRRFCAAEPSAVLLAVESCEQKWSSDVRHGEDYIVELLNDYRASWALIRQWAGHDAAIAMREAEIQKLERLVWDAVYALQKAGLDHEASRLRRALERLVS